MELIQKDEMAQQRYLNGCLLSQEFGSVDTVHKTKVGKNLLESYQENI